MATPDELREIIERAKLAPRDKDDRIMHNKATSLVRSAEMTREEVAAKRRAAQAIKVMRSKFDGIATKASAKEMTARVRKICNMHGYDPIDALISMLDNGAPIVIIGEDGEAVTTYVPLDAKDQIAVHKEILKFTYPQQKALSVESKVDVDLNVTVKQYSQPYEGKETAVDAEFSMIGKALATSKALK